MKTFIDKLNLKSNELRFLGFVALVLFVVINIWLVWPHFSEWTKVKNEIAKANRQLQEWQKKVALLPQKNEALRKLQTQGPTALVEGQAADLLTSIQTHEQLNNVIDRGIKPAINANAPTNQFFEEFAYNININVGNEELIKFLTSLATTNSMIRVREMEIHKDAGTGGSRLAGTLKLVASYQKKPAAAPPVPAPATKTAPSKPFTPTKAVTNPVGKAVVPGKKS